MAETKRIFDYFRVSLDRLQSVAITSLWVSLFTGGIGLLVIAFPVVLMLTSLLFPVTEENIIRSFVISKVASVLITLVIIVPIIKFVRWVTKKTDNTSSWILTHIDPFLGLGLMAISPIALLWVVTRFPSDPTVTGEVELFLHSGLYLLISAVGVAATASFVLGFTILAEYLQWLDPEKVIEVLRSCYQRIITISPIRGVIRFHEYTYRTDSTYFESIKGLASVGYSSIVQELQTAEIEESSPESDPDEDEGHPAPVE